LGGLWNRCLSISRKRNNSFAEEIKGAFQNQTLETILNRKSVRTYLDKEISPKILNDLLKAGMAAPSSRDRRPWPFIVISDKAILKDLGENGISIRQSVSERQVRRKENPL
jgi:hypothetical protein